MGLNPDEDSKEYGNDCLDCFPAGKTPKYVWASFTGIEMSPIWNPADQPPPNGIYRLEQHPVIWCTWILVLGLWTFGWGRHLFFQQLAATWNAIDHAFVDQGQPPCATAFQSILHAGSGEPWMGGQGQVSMSPPEDPSSLLSIADLVQIPIGTKTKADFWPIDLTDMMSMYVDHPTSTKIYMRTKV